MANQIHVIAFMYPDPEKVDRLIELIQTVVEYVHDHEPAVWQYEYYRSTTKDNQPVVVVIERYFDQSSVDVHMHAEGVQKFAQALTNEKICIRDHKMYFLSKIAGFKRS